MKAELITLEKASLWLPDGKERKTILHDLDWSLHVGEHTALLGRNGAGKTTLLRLMSGAAWSTGGTVTWHTEDGAETSRIAGMAVTAMVSPEQQQNFQAHAWDITGRELLLTGFDGTAFLYTRPDEEREAMAEALARDLDCANLLERRIPTLSQGQMRILLLGRALIREPKLLLLDECTDGLDARHRDLFHDVLSRFAGRCTVVVTTHREGRIPSWCKGRMYISHGHLSRTQMESLAEAKPRNTAAGLVFEQPDMVSKPLVSLRRADVYIDRELILKHLDWDLRKGERWLLEGVNGSGKSTLLRLLAGDEIVAWPGVIEFGLPKGRDGEIALENLRRHVRLVSDLSQAFYGYDLTCLDLVLSGIDNTVGVYRDFTEKEIEQGRALLRAVDLADLENDSIRRISTGQERRLFLARALAGNPSILLLDEPCTGLDDESRDAYLDALDRAAAKGLVYVFVSHYVEDTPGSVNRRARMSDGVLTVEE